MGANDNLKVRDDGTPIEIHRYAAKVMESNDPKRLQQYREQSNHCSMYDPCPICFKCQAKAAHLYEKCAKCPVPHDAHNHNTKSWAIRRENFAVTVTKETEEALAQEYFPE